MNKANQGLQEEVKANILHHAADDYTEVTITIEDPIALAEILKNVWIKNVDFSDLDFDHVRMSLDIKAVGVYDFTAPEDDLEKIV